MVNRQVATASLTLAVTAGAAAAWNWAPWLVAGTALAELGPVIAFGGVLAFMAAAQPATMLLLRRLESSHWEARER